MSTLTKVVTELAPIVGPIIERELPAIVGAASEAISNFFSSSQTNNQPTQSDQPSSQPAPLSDRTDQTSSSTTTTSSSTQTNPPASGGQRPIDDDSSSYRDETPIYAGKSPEEIARLEVERDKRIDGYPIVHPAYFLRAIGRGISSGFGMLFGSGRQTPQAHRSTRQCHSSTGTIHYKEKNGILQRREAYKELGGETQEYFFGVSGVESDLLPRHMEGRKDVSEVLEDSGISTFKKYPKMCEKATQLEHVAVEAGRVPGVQAMHPTIAVALKAATQLNYEGDKNYLMLRHPSTLVSGRETHERVSEGLAQGKKDNEMNQHLMSFSFSVLGGSRKSECALHALQRWNATAPSKVIEKIMTPTLKGMGFNDTEIQELLESTAWKTLIEQANEIQHSEFLSISMPKEGDKLKEMAYVSGRYGVKSDVGFDEVMSPGSCSKALKTDGEAQFRLVCSKETMSPDADIEMFLVNLDRQKVDEHLKDKDCPPLDSTELGKLFPEKHTKEERAAKEQWDGCNKLIKDFVDLAKAKAKEKQEG